MRTVSITELLKMHRHFTIKQGMETVDPQTELFIEDLEKVNPELEGWVLVLPKGNQEKFVEDVGSILSGIGASNDPTMETFKQRVSLSPNTFFQGLAKKTLGSLLHQTYSNAKEFKSLFGVVEEEENQELSQEMTLEELDKLQMEAIASDLESVLQEDQNLMITNTSETKVNEEDTEVLLEDTMKNSSSLTVELESEEEETIILQEESAQNKEDAIDLQEESLEEEQDVIDLNDSSENSEIINLEDSSEDNLTIEMDLTQLEEDFRFSFNLEDKDQDADSSEEIDLLGESFEGEADTEIADKPETEKEPSLIIEEENVSEESSSESTEVELAEDQVAVSLQEPEQEVYGSLVSTTDYQDNVNSLRAIRNETEMVVNDIITLTESLQHQALIAVGKKETNDFPILSNETFHMFMDRMEATNPAHVKKLFMYVMKMSWRMGDVKLVSKVCNEMAILDSELRK